VRRINIIAQGSKGEVFIALDGNPAKRRSFMDNRLKKFSGKFMKRFCDIHSLLPNNFRHLFARILLFILFILLSNNLRAEEIRIGNLYCKYDTGGRIEVYYKNKRVLRYVYSYFPDSFKFPGGNNHLTSSKDVEDGKILEYRLAGKDFREGHNTISFKLTSHSVDISYEIERDNHENYKGYGAIGLHIDDLPIHGASYTGTDFRGKPFDGTLSEDPNWKDKTITDIKSIHLKVAAPNLFSMTIEIDGLPGHFAFQDYRKTGKFPGTRRIVKSIGKPKLDGTLRLSFDEGKGACFQSIDISSQANMAFKDDIANDEKGGWSDDGPGNDLAGFPIGKRYFSGIPFNVIDPEKNRGNSCIILKGSKKHGIAFPDSVSVPINNNAAAIYLLHGSAWTGTGKGTETARAIVEYEGRESETFPIVNGEDVIDWHYAARASAKPLPNYFIGWQGYVENAGGNVGIGVSQFFTKYSDKNIEKIILKSHGSGPLEGIIGVTIAQPAVKLVHAVGGMKLVVPALNIAVPGELQRRLVTYDIGSSGLLKAGLNFERTVKAVPGKHHVLFLSQGDTITREDAEAIKKFVENGGGLFVQGLINEKSGFTFLSDLLPVKPLGDTRKEIDSNKDILLLKILDTTRPLFNEIDWDKYCGMDWFCQIEPKDGAQVLAKWSNNEPAMVEWNYGKGRVIYFGQNTYGGERYTRLFRYWPDLQIFYLKLFYHLSGNDKYTAYLSNLPLCKKLSDKINDLSVAAIAKTENLRAIANYLVKKDALKEYEQRIKKIEENMDKANKLQAVLKLDKAVAQYKAILEEVKNLIRDLSTYEESQLKEVNNSNLLKAIETTSGPPIAAGTHCSSMLYYNRHSERGLEIRRHQQELLNRRWGKLGWNSFADMSVLASFIKLDADPSNFEASDVLVHRNDNIIQACKNTGFGYYAHVCAKDISPRTGPLANTAYCSKGLPTLGEDYKKTGYYKRYKTPAFRFNIYNEQSLKRREQVLYTLVNYYSDKDEVHGFDLTNEPRYYMVYTPETIEFFQDWLLRKYSDINEINKTLHTSYKDKRDIVPPRVEEIENQGMHSSSLRAVWSEWKQFNDYINVRHYKQDCETIRKAAPGKKIMDRFSQFALTPIKRRGVTGSTGAGIPYAKVTKYIDVTGIHCHNLYHLDMMRGYSNGKELGLSEYYQTIGLAGPYQRLDYYPGIGGRFAILTEQNKLNSLAAATRNLWVCLSRGVRTFHTHSWGGSWYKQTSASHIALGTSYEYYPRKCTYLWKYYPSEFAEFRGEVDGAIPVPEVGIIEVPESVYQSMGTPIMEDAGSLHDETKPIFDVLYLPLHIQATPIPVEEDFLQYPVIVAPQALYLRQSLQDKIIDYVNRGGVLMATAPIGMYDEHSFKNGSVLKTIFGLEDPVRMPGATTVTFSSGLNVSISSHIGSWNLNNSNSRTLAHYDNGEAAVLEKDFGKGKAYLIGYSTARSSPLRDQLKLLIGTNIQPRIYCDNSEVHTFLLKKGNHLIVYAVNRMLSRNKVNIELKESADVIDLRAKVKFRTNNIYAELGAGEGRAYKILEY